VPTDSAVIAALLPSSEAAAHSDGATSDIAAVPTGDIRAMIEQAARVMKPTLERG